MQRLKFLDLFSGIGGFRLGMEHAHNQCVGWCDIDKYARQSYLKMYPHAKKEWHAGDIRKVSNHDWKSLNQKVGQINVICGGFPCQSFSIAGRRKGFLDKTRGTLFFQIARAAKIIKPQYLFMENVKGLLNHNHGDTFATILATLDELGYNAEWHVMNSRYFGVPQNRERIYIIAHRRGTKTAEVFDKLNCSSDDPHQIKFINPMQLNNIKPNQLSYFYNARKHGEYGTHDILKPNGISKSLRASRQDNKIALVHHGKHQSKNIYAIDGSSPTVDATTYKHKILVSNKDKSQLKYFHNSKSQDYRIYNDNGAMRALSATDYKHIPTIHRVYDARKHGKYSEYDIMSSKGISPTLSTMQGGNRQPKIALKANKNDKNKVAIPCLTPERIHKRQNGRRFKNNQDPEFTLNTEDRNGVGLMKNNQFVVRKLTPLECWRLQGYPDYLFKRASQVCSNSQLYKQAGNSVSVPVMVWIAKRLKVYKK